MRSVLFLLVSALLIMAAVTPALAVYAPAMAFCWLLSLAMAVLGRFPGALLYPWRLIALAGLAGFILAGLIAASDAPQDDRAYCAGEVAALDQSERGLIGLDVDQMIEDCSDE